MSIKILLSMLILVAVQAFGQTTASVTLQWRPVEIPGFVLEQYRIYWGTESGNYTTNLCAGTNLTDTIDGLEIGRTYYFAVTALATNTINLETPFSNEIKVELRSSGLRLIGFLAEDYQPPEITCDIVASNTSTNSGFGYTKWLSSSAARYVATPFISPGITVCEVTAALQSVGSLQGNVYASIWSGTTNGPVARIGGESLPLAIASLPRMNVFSLTNAIVSQSQFILPSVPISTGTNWLVLRSDGSGTVSNYLLWWRNSVIGGSFLNVSSSADGISWSKTATRRGLHTISATSN